MNGIILYTSKYGATKRYAGWLAEETGFACVEVKQARIEDVKGYDTVVLGGGVYASSVAGLSFLKKNWSELKGKRIVVFCVGASPCDEEAFGQLKAFNLKDELAGLPCFYCRGALDRDAMTFLDRNLCKMLQKAVAKKRPEDRNVLERAIMEAGDQKRDWTDRAYLAPILEAIR